MPCYCKCSVVPWVGLQCVIVVFPDQTHLLCDISLSFFRKRAKNKDSLFVRPTLYSKYSIHVHTIQKRMQYARRLICPVIQYRLRAKKGPAHPPPPPPREFRRHILYWREFQAASFKRCLHSVLRGVSLWQPVTYVTVTNWGKIKMKVWATDRRH